VAEYLELSWGRAAVEVDKKKESSSSSSSSSSSKALLLSKARSQCGLGELWRLAEEEEEEDGNDVGK
jgi:hypothetical protein